MWQPGSIKVFAAHWSLTVVLRIGLYWHLYQGCIVIAAFGITTCRALGRCLSHICILNKHEESNLIFNPTDPLSHMPTMAKPDWTPAYGKAKELLPPKMLEPLGHPVTILTFDDTVVPSCSHSGILLFVQNSPILWLSWQQNTVETSMFGSEFVTLRTAHDMIIALRY